MTESEVLAEGQDPRDRRDDGAGASVFRDEQGQDAAEGVNPTDTPEQDGAGQDDADNGEDDPVEDRLVAKLRREAASHRVRARELEQERDVANEQVRRLQRQAVERASGLPDVSVLERTGIELAELVADDGRVDEAKVGAAVDSVRRSLGLDPVGVRRGVGGGGLSPDADHRGSAGSLEDALRPRRR